MIITRPYFGSEKNCAQNRGKWWSKGPTKAPITTIQCPGVQVRAPGANVCYVSDVTRGGQAGDKPGTSHNKPATTLQTLHSQTLAVITASSGEH